MKTIKNVAFQGDMMVRRVASVPSGATPQKTENGLVILTHSETGHHHAIDATDGVALFQDPKDPLVAYLQLDGIEYADVVHHRPWDTHETLRLLGAPAKKTVYEVRRQREYTPEGWRRVA